MDNAPCTYRISIKAVIKDDAGRLMLVKEADGRWELPGGGLEHGEEPRQGLIREIAEETGLIVDWMSEYPVAFWTIKKEVGSPSLKWFALVAYEARVSGQFRADPNGKESQEAHYFSLEEAKNLKLHSNTQPYVDKFSF